MIAKIIQFNYTTFDIIIGFYEENELVGSRCVNAKYCGMQCKHCGYCTNEMSNYIDVKNKEILADTCEVPENLSTDGWNSWLEYWSYIALKEYINAVQMETNYITIINQKIYIVENEQPDEST